MSIDSPTIEDILTTNSPLEVAESKATPESKTDTKSKEAPKIDIELERKRYIYFLIAYIRECKLLNVASNGTNVNRVLLSSLFYLCILIVSKPFSASNLDFWQGIYGILLDLFSNSNESKLIPPGTRLIMSTEKIKELCISLINSAISKNSKTDDTTLLLDFPALLEQAITDIKSNKKLYGIGHINTNSEVLKEIGKVLSGQVEQES